MHYFWCSPVCPVQEQYVHISVLVSDRSTMSLNSASLFGAGWTTDKMTDQSVRTFCTDLPS